MPNEPRPLAAAFAAVLFLAALGASGCGSGAGLDPGRLPPSMRAQYQRFEARCSRCHSLSRPLSAPVDSVEHWEKYLARMRRMPGSGINSQDAAMIMEFLAYYTTVVRHGGSQAEVPRTAPGDTGGAEEEPSPSPPPPVGDPPQAFAEATPPTAPTPPEAPALAETTAPPGAEESHDAP